MSKLIFNHGTTMRVCDPKSPHSLVILAEQFNEVVQIRYRRARHRIMYLFQPNNIILYYYNYCGAMDYYIKFVAKAQHGSVLFL